MKRLKLGTVCWILIAIFALGGVGITAVIGTFFGLAYWKLRRLWPIIIAHGLYDTVLFTLVYFGLHESL